MIVKVCGMTDATNIRQTIDVGADIIGMIFYPPSSRCIKAVPAIDDCIRRFGVFVNEDIATVIATAEIYRLTGVQLHGSETPEYLADLHRLLPEIVIAKAISVADADDLQKADLYASTAQLLVFDTKCNSYGGSGKKFHWQLLDNYHGTLPFLLSGGISPNDAEAITTIHHPQMIGVDLNSQFETSPGMKDINKLKLFIHQLKSRQ